jgi:hypothetical protein
MLPAAERRRSGPLVRVALAVGVEAGAGQDMARLPTVFSSSGGDGVNCHELCEMLASNDRQVSPTRFHNSVHNAAAGYWTIGAGCVQPTTAVSSFDATFAHGLLEALVQLHAGAPAVLLVAYDAPSAGPLANVSPSEGLLGGALVLSTAMPPARSQRHGRLRCTLVDADAPAPQGPLARRAGRNAMAPMLPLFQALASGDDLACLHAGRGRALRVEIADA